MAIELNAIVEVDAKKIALNFIALQEDFDAIKWIADRLKPYFPNYSAKRKNHKGTDVVSATISVDIPTSVWTDAWTHVVCSIVLASIQYATFETFELILEKNGQYENWPFFDPAIVTPGIVGARMVEWNPDILLDVGGHGPMWNDSARSLYVDRGDELRILKWNSPEFRDLLKGYNIKSTLPTLRKWAEQNRPQWFVKIEEEEKHQRARIMATANPYKALFLSSDVPDWMLAVYMKALIRTIHPDMWAGEDAETIATLTKMTAIVNEAYSEIKRQRAAAFNPNALPWKKKGERR